MKISSRLPRWAWKLFIALTLFTSDGYAQDPCPNIDFEMGNFTNWQGQLGTCCPIVTAPSPITPGRHTITSGTGTDPNACNAVPVKYPGAAQYLVFPQVALWWLDHYAGLRDHLDRHARVVTREDRTAVIYALDRSTTATRGPARLAGGASRRGRHQEKAR